MILANYRCGACLSSSKHGEHPKISFDGFVLPLCLRLSTLGPKTTPCMSHDQLPAGRGWGGHGYYKEPVHPGSLFMKFCLLTRHVGIFHSDRPPEIVSISFPFQEAAVDVS